MHYAGFHRDSAKSGTDRFGSGFEGSLSPLLLRLFFWLWLLRLLLSWFLLLGFLLFRLLLFWFLLFSVCHPLSMHQTPGS